MNDFDKLYKKIVCESTFTDVEVISEVLQKLIESEDANLLSFSVELGKNKYKNEEVTYYLGEINKKYFWFCLDQIQFGMNFSSKDEAEEAYLSYISEEYDFATGEFRPETY